MRRILIPIAIVPLPPINSLVCCETRRCNLLFIRAEKSCPQSDRTQYQFQIHNWAEDQGLNSNSTDTLVEVNLRDRDVKTDLAYI